MLQRAIPELSFLGVTSLDYTIHDTVNVSIDTLYYISMMCQTMVTQGVAGSHTILQHAIHRFQFSSVTASRSAVEVLHSQIQSHETPLSPLPGNLLLATRNVADAQTIERISGVHRSVHVIYHICPHILHRLAVCSVRSSSDPTRSTVTGDTATSKLGYLKTVPLKQDGAEGISSCPPSSSSSDDSG